MKNYKAILYPDGVYHVYNMAYGNEKLFVENMNYYFFLNKFKEYIHPIADIYSYCLMPNHFHVLLKIKSENELNNYFKVAWQEKGKRSKSFSINRKLTQQFSNFFNAYTKAFNKVYGRLGGLFISNYRRIKVESDRQFIDTVKYIHLNPVQARISNKPENWNFSSYRAFISQGNTLVDKGIVLNYFGDLENFVYVHNNP